MAKEARNQRLAAAAALAVAGHPGAAAAIVGSHPAMSAVAGGARVINDSVLAPLQRAAVGGAGWAQLSRMAAEQGLPQSAAREVLDRMTSKPYTPDLSLAPATPLSRSLGASDYSTSLATGLSQPMPSRPVP